MRSVARAFLGGSVVVALVAVAIALGGVLASGSPAAAADDVYLTNGTVFQNVVAREQGEQLVVQLEIGKLVLRRTQVARVERAETALEGLLALSAQLRAAPSAGATDWLALARLADLTGLADLARDAALRAAKLEPLLAGLPSLLVPLGYELEHGVWLPYGDVMRRRGYLLVDGSWLSAAQAEEHRRATAAERGRAEQVRRAQERAGFREREAEPSDAAQLADVALAQVDLMRDLVERVLPPGPPAVFGALPLVFYGAVLAGEPLAGPPRADTIALQRAMTVSPPGSFLPLSAYLTRGPALP